MKRRPETVLYTIVTLDVQKTLQRVTTIIVNEFRPQIVILQSENYVFFFVLIMCYLDMGRIHFQQ